MTRGIEGQTKALAQLKKSLTKLKKTVGEEPCEVRDLDDLCEEVQQTEEKFAHVTSDVQSALKELEPIEDEVLKMAKCKKGVEIVMAHADKVMSQQKPVNSDATARNSDHDYIEVRLIVYVRSLYF